MMVKFSGALDGNGFLAGAPFPALFSYRIYGMGLCKAVADWTDFWYIETAD